MSRWGVIAGVLAGALACGVSAPPAGAGAAARGESVTAASRIVTVDSGDTTTCGLDAAGFAYCWGANSSGGVGDGTRFLRRVPTRVTGGELPAGTRFASVSSGAAGACALTAEGQPYCWGSGLTGGVGESLPVAVPVGGLAFTAVTVATVSACGLTAAGVAYCWGRDYSGVLGDGTTGGHPEPVAVATSARFTSLSAGWSHVCGVSTGGAAYCWGSNEKGQLGDGTTTDRATPVAVDFDGGAFASVAAGRDHTCALTTGGKPYCWGEDGANQSGGSGGRPDAVEVGGLTFTALTAGGEHSCGLTGPGAVYCWGSNLDGQLGNSNREWRNDVVGVPAGGRTFTSVSAGGLYTCGMTAESGALCWGGNRWGQLGNGATTSPMVPTAVPAEGAVFAELSTGANFTCGLTAAGAAYCWGGRNDRGQVGDGTREPRPTAVPVVTSGLPAGTRFTHLEAGNEHVCAVAAAGTVYCWGWNYRNQLGNMSGADEPLPVAVTMDGLPAGTRFTDVSAGESHTCGLTAAGAVYCWGANFEGQLGDGTFADRPAPVPVDTAALPAGTRFTAVTAGDYHTCALAVSQVAYCWGANGSGRLGDGTTTSRPSPVAVTGSTFVRIAAGTQHTCGVTTAAAVSCWGENGSGQLGDDTQTDRSTPAPIPTREIPAGARFTDVDAAWGHTCAVADGVAYCWGTSSSWELGQGEQGRYVLPGPVVMPDGVRFTDTTIGYAHSCALTTAGAAYCWGANEEAQLGMGVPWAIGAVLDASEPVPPVTDTVPPTGGLTVSAPTVAVGRPVTATLAGPADNVDPVSDIGVVLSWGDGTEGVIGYLDRTVTKTYARPGVYHVRLTLADTAGNRRTQSAVVTVVAPSAAFKLDRASVWHGQSFQVTISAVPAGTTKITLNWADGYVSTLKGVGQRVSHRYYHRNKGALVPAGAIKPTAVLTGADGSTAPIAVGTVTIKPDTAKPKSAVTKPKKPERVSSWKTLRGTASDQGSGVRVVRVVAKRASGGKTYCYTAKQTWIKVTGGNSAGCGADVTVSGGAWSLALKSLAKGTLTVTAVPTDWSDRAGAAAKVTQKLTRA